MRLVQSVGVNDLKDSNSKTCLYYRCWSAMLQRCYSKSYQDRQPTYKGCSVIKSWLTFSNFKLWMGKQDWQGKSLDKDLLIPNNKVYGPKTCVFIDQALNNLLTNHAAARGQYPIGVEYDRGRFKASVRSCGKRIYLGCFRTPKEAHQAWRKAKAQIILNSRELTNDIRVKNSLAKRAKELLL